MPMLTLPSALTDLHQWVLWRYDTRKGKPTKVPYQTSHRRAKSDDPRTWMAFNAVAEAWAMAPTRYQGIGFVFSHNDPFAGVDLDDCIGPDGNIKAWASPIIERFSGTYMEISPSGRGVKIWAKARVNGPGRRGMCGDGAIEIYDRGRFFTTTGVLMNGAPLQVVELQAQIDSLYDLIARSSPERKATKADLVEQTSVSEGKRYHYLQSLAAQFRAKGMNRDEIYAALATINKSRCKPPKPETVVQELSDWAAILEPHHRRAVQRKTLVEPGRDHSDWRESLIALPDGKPRPILANAMTALRRAPEWIGVLAFDEFSLTTVALKSAPWPGSFPSGEWTDHDDRQTTNWLHQCGVYVTVEIAGQAVQTVARDRPFHPVRDYLDSLKWDGTPRIERWLGAFLGVKPSEYAVNVGMRWLVSAVARIYEPGVKADCCLILEGPQGSKKSTALRILADPWFTDEIADLGSKDAAMQTRGVWIIELAELDSMTRSEVSRIKAFMSRATDRFRPPYGKRLVTSPRQCVFAGSVNHPNYLRDETGGRRFWPVTCTRILIDDLKRDRDQLWAEAVERYRTRTPWWLDTPELNQLAAQEQADRYEGDPWDEPIAKWVVRPVPRHDGSGHTAPPFSSSPESVTVSDVLSHCLGKRTDQWTQSDKNRVARSLRSLGWERYRARSGAEREWRYRPGSQ